MNERKLLHTTKPKRRLVVIDQQPVVSCGIEKLLTNSDQYEMVDAVNNGLEALPSYRKFQPEIVVLEPNLPGLSGLDVVMQLKQRDPKIKVVVYTALQDYVHLRELIAQGVEGIVLKQQPVQHLLDALAAVGSNQFYWDPCLQKTELSKQGPEERGSGHARLSPRERQILKLIAEGFKNKEIAEKFSISIKTVESHRLNLMRKLDAHHAVELVNWARKLQLI